MPTVLVVDDDHPFETFCREQLAGRQGGAEPLELLFAHTDAAALALLEERRDLDLALVAVDNPGLSGLGLFHLLEGRGREHRLPRIALCGCNDARLMRLAMREGAADFLAKPVSFAELEESIRDVVAQTRRRRQAWHTEARLAALDRELAIAGEIQQHILRADFPRHPDLELHARTHPARGVGGDFYDFFDLPGGKLGVVMADVVGKGVPAAFFMAVAYTLIRMIASDGLPPGECLAQVNTLLCRHNVPGMLVSACYGVLEPRGGRFTFASAGHPPLYRLTSGGVATTVEGGEGVVIGVQEGLTYPEGELTLGRGEALLFYTDGVTEAFDGERRPFGEERLRQWLADHPGSARELVEGVFGAVEAFVGGADPSDDLTVLALRRPG